MDGTPDDAGRANGPAGPEMARGIPQARPIERAEIEPPEPFSAAELRRAFVRPHLIVEYVLGGRDRLASNLSSAQALGLLVGLLLVTSLAATIPYGVLSPARNVWKVAVLYTGSLLICFPCLHVFAQFLGFRYRVEQNLALSLVITSAAGLFTFGFFPIIWFIDFSTDADVALTVSVAGLSVWLLAVSLLMGIVQMGRCLMPRNGLAGQRRAFGWLVALWMPVLVFITYRMARVLALI
jgi:hypothetical protein